MSKIHCLKEGQPCHDGKTALEEELEKDDPVEDDITDTFASVNYVILTKLGKRD